MAKFPPSILACGCGRIGYALVLCPLHAPIPYELTDKGRREARRMRQWDAIEGALEERRRHDRHARDNARALAAARRAAAAAAARDADRAHALGVLGGA